MEQKILVADDEPLIRRFLQKELAGQGYVVFAAEDGQSAISLAQQQSPDLVILDLKLPDLDGIEILKRLHEIDPHLCILIITAYGTIDTAIQAIRLGACDYITKPFDLEAIFLSVRKALQQCSRKRDVISFREGERSKFGLQRIVGESPAMVQTRQFIKQIARSEASTILLEGETGTGKDLVARAIHTESSRAAWPFVEVNCAALPETLVESELFGHEPGAFTDARSRKVGLLEVAHKGTFYLNEIGDMNPALQSKLLSVIENKRFRRLGGLKDLSLDIRFIAASSKNLAAAVEKEDFRRDLFYRLKVFSVMLPPLRERLSDIPLLVDFLLLELRKDFKKQVTGMSPEVLTILGNYPWPGNVRELKNLLERAFILCETETIEARHLPAEIMEHLFPPPPGASRFKLPSQGIDLRVVERDFIQQALELCRGNQIRAAKLLKISRDTLRYRMKKFGWR